MDIRDLKHKEVITVDEACLITGLGKRTMRALATSGKILAHKPNGRHIYIDKQGLINWMLGK